MRECGSRERGSEGNERQNMKEYEFMRNGE